MTEERPGPPEAHPGEEQTPAEADSASVDESSRRANAERLLREARERAGRGLQFATMLDALDHAEPRPADGAPAAAKSTYANRLSSALARVFANRLRPWFDGILPDEQGRGQESKARSAKGYKKLDVNYSTVELGLGLGVSIKTLNFRDAASARYTKNYTRIDAELRAEAMDYHQRQPYAVLAGLLFLPIDACDDAGRGSRVEQGVSSFGAAARHFRRARVLRSEVSNALDLFECFLIGLYQPAGDQRGDVVFYDVMRPRPPRNRRPADDEVLTLEQAVDAIRATYDARNNPPFEFAD